MNAKSAGCALWLLFASLFAMNVRADTGFSPVGKGVELAQFDWHPKSLPTSQLIHFLIARIDPGQLSVRVVDTRHLSKHEGKLAEQVSFSLREVMRLRRPRIAINGGFTGSYVRPVPTGLVIAGGKVLAPLNDSSKTQTGILCVQDAGQVSIVRLSETAQVKCSQALQAGPIVIEAGGVNGINRSQAAVQAARSLIGIDSIHRVYFIATSRVSLFTLGEAFTGDDPIGILLDTLLNLDGDADSGMIIGDTDTEVEFGNIDATIPNSVVAVTIK